MDIEYTREDLQKIGAKWIERIRAAEKREDDWLKDAEAAERAFLVEKGEDTELPDFNILHSNVETIVPSIYNSTPSPDIRPRHNVKDPVGKAVADVYERVIQTLIDDDVLDTEVEGVAQDAFLTGRGILRLKFDADEVPPQHAPVLDEMGSPLMDEAGEPLQREIAPASVTNERVAYEVVSWRDYREGAAKRWQDVPWVAYRHVISQEDLDDIEDPEIKELLGDHRESGEAPTENEELDVDIWEIWCKDTGRVYFVVEQSQRVLKMEDDPLGLAGFFPQPSPVQPITGTGKRCPVCPYSVYKKLARELDTITQRINAITRGLKVRGLFAGNAEAIEELAAAGDNVLVPLVDLENLGAIGDLEKAVLWWPIDTAIAVLKELQVNREMVKQQIYELTGISDIMRGEGKASETATAQSIKQQWGSTRIKKMQRMIERLVRDAFVLTSELISRHFSLATMQRMSGVQIDRNMQQLLSAPIDHFRIDVESDSTVRADMVKNREEMSQFLEGTAQFFSTMAPVVQQAPQAAGPIVEMYSAFARQFNLGKQAEDALEQFAEMAKQVASQPRPNPEAEQAKAEMALEVEKLKVEIEKIKIDAQVKAADVKLKEQQLNLEEAKAEADVALRMTEKETEDA